MNLTTRLTCVMVLLAFTTAAAVGLFTHRNLEAAILPGELARMEEHANGQAMRIAGVITAARRDLQAFAAGAAAFEGIMRARAHGGVDPQDGATEALWRARLSRRLAAELEAKTHYAQIRFIGVTDGGREIVKVDRSGAGGTVRVVADAGLQATGSRDYFIAIMKMPRGGLYTSRVDISEDQPTDGVPVPIIRIGTPVYDGEGKGFGLLLLDVDLRIPFEQMRRTAARDRLFIVDEEGRYLLHPRPEFTLGAPRGNAQRLTQDFPELAASLGTAGPVTKLMAGSRERMGVALAPLRLEGGPWVAVIETMPESLLLAPVGLVRHSSLVAGAAVALLAVGAAVWLARSLTRPMLALTRSVESFGAGKGEIAPVAADGEIGVLARAFARMQQDVEAKNEAVKASEELFAKAFQLSPDCVAIVRVRDRTVIRVNDAMAQLWGSTPDAIVGTQTREYSNWLSEEERLAFMSRLSEAGEVLRYETTLRMTDGRLLEFELSSRIIWFEGSDCVLSVIRDITERKQTEAARARLAAIVSSSEDAIISKTLDGTITTWNPGAEKLFGYTAAEAVGRQILTLFPPERVAEEHEIIRRIGDGESVRHFETVRVRKDGRRIDVSVTLSPIINHGGKIIGASKISRDITDKKRAEEKLRESEERYRETLDSMMEGCQIIGRDYRYVYLNTVAAQQGHRPVEELLGRTMMECFPGIEQTPLFTAIRRCMAGGPAEQMENTFAYPDGRKAVFQLGIQPVSEGVFILSLDVTARKKAEEEIRELNSALERRVVERTAQLEAANRELARSHAKIESLFESLPGHYLVLTPAFKIVSASDAYLRATMCTRSAILMRDLFEVFPGNPGNPADDGVANLRASLHRVLATGAVDIMAIQRYDIRRPDGVFEERYWSPINSPVFGADREIEHIIHRVEDVTEFVRHRSSGAPASLAMQARMEQMEAEIYQSAQKIQQANAHLEAANRELEAFSYSVSHDLRAPLRAVDGFSRIVIEDCGPLLPAEGRRYLENIRTGAQQMGKLIDDLLTFSRLSRVPLTKRTVDVGQLVNEVIDALASQRKGRTVDLRVGELPPALGDGALLKQVWMNLVANALKYSRNRDPAVIEIGCERRGTADVYFVRDNGAGFDMRYVAKLFGVFQRLHRAEDYEGTGVGLAIVQRVIQRHGGRVWAEAEVDRGATFYFTLKEVGP